MADATTTEQASNIREGHYILIDDRPCKVLDVLDASNSRRRNWCRFVGRDIFTKNRHVSSDFSPRDNVVVPRVNRIDYEVFHIIPSPPSVLMATKDGCTKQFEVTDQTILNQIRARLASDRADISGRYLVATVLSAMGEEQICAFKAINPIYPVL